MISLRSRAASGCCCSSCPCGSLTRLFPIVPDGKKQFQQAPPGLSAISLRVPPLPKNESAASIHMRQVIDERRLRCTLTSSRLTAPSPGGRSLSYLLSGRCVTIPAIRDKEITCGHEIFSNSSIWVDVVTAFRLRLWRGWEAGGLFRFSQSIQAVAFPSHRLPVGSQASRYGWSAA